MSSIKDIAKFVLFIAGFCFLNFGIWELTILLVLYALPWFKKPHRWILVLNLISLLVSLPGSIAYYSTPLHKRVPIKGDSLATWVIKPGEDLTYFYLGYFSVILFRWLILEWMANRLISTDSKNIELEIQKLRARLLGKTQENTILVTGLTRSGKDSLCKALEIKLNIPVGRRRATPSATTQSIYIIKAPSTPVQDDNFSRLRFMNTMGYKDAQFFSESCKPSIQFFLRSVCSGLFLASDAYFQFNTDAIFGNHAGRHKRYIRELQDKHILLSSDNVKKLLDSNSEQLPPVPSLILFVFQAPLLDKAGELSHQRLLEEVRISIQNLVAKFKNFLEGGGYPEVVYLMTGTDRIREVLQNEHDIQTYEEEIDKIFEGFQGMAFKANFSESNLRKYEEYMQSRINEPGTLQAEDEKMQDLDQQLEKLLSFCMHRCALYRESISSRLALLKSIE